VTERFIVKEYTIRRFGALTVFFMWIKIFYWMRLFEPLAKYVNLIVHTIIDCMWFLALVIIITFSFANFFFIMDLNLND